MTVAPCIAAVEIARLEKCYGPLKVLHDISLKAQPGEVKMLGTSVRPAKRDGEEASAESGGAEIVTLDRFRKK